MIILNNYIQFFFKPMVILFNSDGRFGHQLSQFATLIAYANKYDRSFYYWRFKSRFGSSFARNSDSKLAQVSLSIILIFLCYKLLKFFSVKKYTFLNIEFQITNDKNNELVFDDTLEGVFASKAKYVVTDYVFNDVPNLLKYREHIVSCLLPNTDLQNKTDNFINVLNQQYKLLVGLHIRRDDFKDFANGIFYFNDETYIKAITHFLRIINFDAKDIVFVICSDEIIDIHNYIEFNISYQQRSFEDDFFILAKCNYIIATRSIFSTLANYISTNKIYQIVDADKEFTMEDFKCCEALLSENYNLKEKKDFI